VTEMMASRMDNIILLEELQALNRSLDRTVEERTKELRESENRFRQFFENVPAYCYMISRDGIILDLNKSALATLGYRKHEIVGKPVQMIYAPEWIPAMTERFNEWRATGKLSDVEMVIISKNGERRTVLLSADVVKDAEGNLGHSISVQQDITERKRAEESMRKLNEELELRVKERTLELQTQNAQLEQMNRLFVGRELKMVELKQQIKRLEEDLIRSGSSDPSATGESKKLP
jgi:PAS domain S-box-containing protein